MKMHKLKSLSYVPDEEGTLTACWRNVDRQQLAAFDEGVTCKRCLASMKFDEEAKAWADAHRAKRSEQELSKS